MKMMIVLALMASAICVSASPQLEKSKSASANPKAVEARAMRMVKSALSLFESKEDERAVGMLEAVSRVYPESQTRFKAALELGRHFIDKRAYDRSLMELRKAILSENAEIRAESLLLQGYLYLGKGSASEAVMCLRKLTLDYPTSSFANDAYYAIGQIHFEARRWARASEAFEMVGTAVPVDALTNSVVLAEAGQRIFVHVRDKDLAVKEALGEKAQVVISSSSGDVETAVLESFGRGDGDFIASVRTAAAASAKHDGVLTVHGSEPVSVRYVDSNTENGAVNVERVSKAQIVSTAVIAFKDGAERQRVKGVFVGQPAFLHLKDSDLDVSQRPDSVSVLIKAQYRERPQPPPGETIAPPPAADAPWITRFEKTLVLTENGDRTGVFVGRVVPMLMGEGDSVDKADRPGEIAVRPDEKIVVEYVDKRHLNGDRPEVRTAEVYALVGGSTQPQSIVAHSSESQIQAKKLLLEAQLLHKWGSIFRDVGLSENAKAKAEEGLKRIADVFEIASKNTLERDIVEQAFETRWNLYLVVDKLQSAIATCNQLVRLYPDTVIADRAFMQIANAHIQENTPDSLNRAITILGSIIKLPNSSLKAEAQYRIGEVLENRARKTVSGKKPDFSPAIMAFKRCAETYPSSSFAGEAYKKIVDYNVSIRNYSAAIEILERVFQDYPDAPWLDEMLLKWGVVVHRMGDTEGAKAKFQRIVEEYPGGNAAKTATKFLQRLSE